MLKHTPYAKGSGPFAIGLTPLDLANWIEVDQELPTYLAEKKRLMSQIPGEVFAADYRSEAAQEEVLNLLVDHLFLHFSDIYSRDGSLISIKNVDEKVDLDDLSKPPLLQAAMLVQEDLVLLRKEGDAWHFVAGSVCFPSSWVLREKIGRPMHDVHAPVPGYQKGSRNAAMIERIFDNLQVDLPVERFNWSLYEDDRLYQGGQSQNYAFNRSCVSSDCFLRVEHQTLRRLPKTGDILFTIRIHIDPIGMLAKRSDGNMLAREFVSTIKNMPEEQIAYKGMAESRDVLIAELEEMAR